MMKTGIYVIAVAWSLFPVMALSQPAGYYNGTEGKSGTELKAALHGIVSGHVDFSYSQAKYIINYSDSDPANESNVILFYTQRSQSAATYGIGPNDINREHVWAKSHGEFSGKRPMDSDAFNLRPADAPVNLLRSNLDFDVCSATGTPVSEAPGTYYTSSAWEPSDAVKGQVARIIFYMAVRYEGGPGEIDLEPADALNTAPKPLHGKLSTLLQWNRDFPPSSFERRRNERIFQAQQNRNPFVDHPEFADLIWASGTPPAISIGNLSMLPRYPKAGEPAQVSATVTSQAPVNSVRLYWGKSYNSESSSTMLTASGNQYSGQINLTGFSQDEYVYFKIVADDGSSPASWHGSYRIPRSITPQQLTPIATIQGTGNISPIEYQVVTTAGILSANFDNTFYIQTSTAPYSGLCVFGSNLNGAIGDSIVVTGRVKEYQGLTELDNVSYVYNFRKYPPPVPVDLTISQLNESYEGVLVRIKGAVFTNGGTIIPSTNATYYFSDGTGTLALYSRYESRLVGYQVPSGTVDVTGVISQYGDNLQILVRDINDITAGTDTEPPQFTQIEVLDPSWLMLYFNEKLEKASAESTGNFSINNGIQVLGAYLYENTMVSLNISNLVSGTHTVTANGVRDLYGNATSNASRQFSYTVSSAGEPAAERLLVYPNPSDGMFGLTLPEGPWQDVGVEIYDPSGRKVYSCHEYPAGSRQIRIEAPGLQPGLYILKLTSGSESLQSRIMIR